MTMSKKRSKFRKLDGLQLLAIDANVTIYDALGEPSVERPGWQLS